MRQPPKLYPCVITNHTTSWHDGGVAVLLKNGTICALASERVGDRHRHEWNSALAYEYLKARFKNSSDFASGTETDYFDDVSNGLRTNDHHFNHAASAFYGSPYSEAAILIIDGQGYENGKSASISLWKGEDTKLQLVEILSPTDSSFVSHSIGHFYTAVGALAGMENLFEEGKTMGLAAYGQPSEFLNYFRQHVHSNADGTPSIDPNLILAILGNTFGPKYYGWQSQPKQIQDIWKQLLALRSSPVRDAAGDVTPDDMNIAYAGQTILEEIILGLARRAKKLTGSDYLCLAGGVALNAIANGKILQSGLFQDIFIPPAPGDDGQAIGKLFACIQKLKLNVNMTIHNAFYGPNYSDEDVTSTLLQFPHLTVTSFRFDDLIQEVVDRLVQGQVIGWYQDGSELGPRALGNRSILADPRMHDMRDRINSNVKHREWYRPLAPVVIEGEVENFFNLKKPSPFMLIIADVKTEKRQLIPAATHVDGSARVQTVTRTQNEKLYTLIERFGKKTGIPILLNTSFNGRSEPIVESPLDAIRSFSHLNLDALVLGNRLILKPSEVS